MVACAIISVAKLSVPSINFTLPQPLLGGALLLSALLLITVNYIVYRSSVGASVSTPARPEEGLAMPIFSHQPPDPTEKQVRFTISGSEEGMSFWKHDDAGELRAWLDVTNFTSSPIKVDRVVGDILVNNSVIGELHHLRIETISANSACIVLLKSALSAEQIKKIGFQKKQSSRPVTGVGLTLTVYAQISGKSVEIHKSLKTGNHQFVNFGDNL